MLRAILNISLRAKIMAVLFVMSAAVLAVATYDSYDAHRAKSRGAFLRKHYERFDAYRKGAGGALNIASAFIATDPDLVAALAANDGPGAVRVFARAESALRHTSAPDLVILVDRGGDPLDVPGAVDLSPSEAASSALLADVRSGQGIDAELAVFGGVVYQVSAAPVRTADDTTVGGIVLGEPLTAYLADYQEQSDPDVTKQHRLTLLSERGTVLSSVFSEAKRPQLATSLDRSNWGKEDEGTDKVDVIRFDGHTYDFYRAHVRGYTGSAYTDIGAFYLMRIRDFKNAEFDDAFRQSALLYLAVLVLSLILGWFVSTWITRPIARYIKATEDLARGRGDLTKRLDESNKDELGQLAHNLNQVFGHIHDLAAKVQRAALQVGASSAEISAASKQMLEGAQEQARKTESSTAAVTELSTSIQQVAENALEATRVAKSSGQAVQSAIERMNEIRATVEEAASKIGELGESGKRIGNIVEVIRQISDQTTLLALNAAIEAAHAGEQGRGFAVVADEVSSLAKRVGQSARDIEDLIATIKEQTTDAVKTMTEGTREVEAGTKLVTATLADLQKLVQVVEDTANAVQEQAVASDEIARNMDAVQRIAQDVLGSSEEAVAQGDHLHRLAHGLEESVKGFRIDDTASSASDALPARSARALPEPRDEKKG